MTEPRVDRPVMPEGYGVESATFDVAWATVVAKLTESPNYWLATSRPDGRPHVVPRWGVWLDGRFWYDGSPETVHVRNLEVNPSCTINLESGSDVVIVEGKSLRPDPIAGDLGERLAATDLPAALALEAEAQCICMQHPDFREAYEAFVGKREPKFR